MKLSTLLRLAVCAFAFAAPLAYATDLTLRWVAPTAYTDGTKIPAGAAITYNVYGAHQGVTPLPKLAGGVTTLSNVRYNVDVGTQCYAVSAVVDGVESAPTVAVCVGVLPPPPPPPPPIPPPNPPSGLTVSIAGVPNTAYTLIKQTDKLAFIPVGTVPPLTPCIPTQEANGYYLVPRALVTFSGYSHPAAVFAKCS